MKTESRILLIIGFFFAVITAIYWFTSFENAGTVMLIGGVGLCFLPGLYYFWWSRHMKPRLEDRPDATIEDGQGVVDAFPGSSIWPFVLGMGAFFVGMAFVFGAWLAPVAGALIVSAAVGATVESRRGGTV